MIEYSPNRNWVGDLKHLSVSYTIQRVLRATIWAGLYAAAVTAALIYFKLEGGRLTSGAFSLLGVILSIILVFRTNTAYDRWWEGRKCWGALINHSRCLAIQVNACFPAEDVAARRVIARLLGNFALALSGHLRGKVETSELQAPHPEDGPGPETEACGNLPVHIVLALETRLAAARRGGSIDATDLLGMKPHSQALLDASGACERILKTPIPFSYSVFIKLYLISYLSLLPFGLAPEYGYLTIPLVMLLTFALMGLELMASEIEDPFGLDCNDLATHTWAANIAKEVAELAGVGAVVQEPVIATYEKVF